MLTTLKWTLMLLLIAGPAGAGTWSLQFDGVDDWVEIPASPLDDVTPSQGFTCEGWVKVHRVDADGGIEWDEIFHNGPLAEFAITVDIDQWMGFSMNFSDIDWQGVDVEIQWNEWFHFAAVYDRPNAHMRLYVNGVLGDDRFVASDKPWASTGCGMGTFVWDLSRPAYFNGWISCMRFTEGARYNADFTPPTTFEADAATVALYGLEAGAGDSIEDDSAHSHDGINHGSTWVRTVETATSESSWSALKLLY